MIRTPVVIDGKDYVSDNIGGVFPLTDAERGLVPSLDKAKASLDRRRPFPAKN